MLKKQGLISIICAVFPFSQHLFLFAVLSALCFVGENCTVETETSNFHCLAVGKPLLLVVGASWFEIVVAGVVLTVADFRFLQG